MRKKILLLICLSFYSLFTFSQWGVKGGLNLSTFTDKYPSKYKIGGHIGATYDIKMSEKWYFQPELQLTSVGCNLHDDGYILKGGHVDIYALELPLSFSFRPTLYQKIKLLLDMGAYVRYGLFGNKTYRYYDGGIIDRSPFDAYRRFDTGLNLGLGLQVKQYYGIFSWQMGVIEVEDGTGHLNQVFKLSFGYRF